MTEQNRSAMLVVLGLLIVALVIYAETFTSMMSVWFGSSTYLHGILILPMSAYLIWRDRGLWMPAQFRRSALGFGLLVLCVFGWLLGSLVSVQAVSQFAFIGILISIIWSVLGTDVVRVLHFPLLFAFFAVPFGDFLIPKLMDWTAHVTVVALKITGIPVVQEGNYFALPSGNFRVIEACSGLRFLIIALVLGLYFAHETFRHWKKRAIFMVMIVATLIGANWVRAYFVVLIAHISKMKYGTGSDHIYFGWLMFLIAITVVFWIGRKFQRPDDLADMDWLDRLKRDGLRHFSANWPSTIVVGILVIAVLGAGPWLLMRAYQSDVRQPYDVTLPVAHNSWVGPQSVTLGFEPGFVGASQSVSGQYRRGSQVVDVFVYFYWHEHQGSELVGWRSRLLRGGFWRIDPMRQLEIHIGSLTQMQLDESLITDGVRRLRVWHWYDIGGKYTADPRIAKLYQAWDILSGNRIGDAALVLVAQDFDPTGEAGVGPLPAFLEDNFEAVQACMRLDNHSPRKEYCAPRRP